MMLKGRGESHSVVDGDGCWSQRLFRARVTSAGKFLRKLGDITVGRYDCGKYNVVV